MNGVSFAGGAAGCEPSLLLQPRLLREGRHGACVGAVEEGVLRAGVVRAVTAESGQFGVHRAHVAVPVGAAFSAPRASSRETLRAH